MHRHATQVGSHLALSQRDYPHGTRARYNAQKCRCFQCRRANSAYESQRQRDPRIPSDEVRRHIAALAEQGIGLRAISDATDVPRVALKRWQLGQPTIRRSIAEKILATDATIIADHALVDATETRRLLRALVHEGYAGGRVSLLLGNQIPALQYKADRVLAKTALRVRKLYDALTAEADDAPAPLSMRERICAALRRFDSVTAEDLFDAMGIGSDNAAMQMLGRLVKAGDVERVGDGKPYRYRTPACAGRGG